MGSFGRLAIGAQDIDRRDDGVLHVFNKFGDWAGKYRSIRRAQRSIIYVRKSLEAGVSFALLELTAARVWSV